MKSLPVALARACMSLALVSSFGSAVFAADLAVTGNLSATGALDIDGNTASFGTSGSNFGYSLIYTDGNPATIDFSASASGADWIWHQGTSNPQLKLDATNTLSLFNPATGLPSIALNPATGANFNVPVTISGNLTANGGFTLPTGTSSAQGLWFGGDTNLYRSAAGLLTTDTSLNVGGHITAPSGWLAVGTNTLYLGAPSTGTIIIPYGATLRSGNDVNNATINMISLGSYGGDTSALLLGNDNAAWPRSIQFRTGIYPTVATERMRIDGNGNVGIGTASPMSRLHLTSVNQTALTIESTNVSSSDTRLIFKSAARTWQIGNDIGVVNSGRFSIWDLTGSADRFTITSSGNVGIGTTAPAAKLDVNGGINFASGNVVGAANLNVSTDTSQAYYYGLSRNSQFTARFNGMKVYNVANVANIPASRIGFFTDNTGYTASTEWMTINELGNVGVGTTTPTVKLDVVGNAKISGTLTVNGAPVIPATGGSFTGGVTIANDNTVSGGLTVGSGTAADGANLRLLSNSSSPQWNVDNYSGTMRFFTESAPNVGAVVKATLTSGGNLGIGTSTPAERLDVAGNLKVTNTSGQTTTINGNTITGSAAGLTLNAGGVNQGVALNASGTGRIHASNGVPSASVSLLSSSIGITMTQNGNNGLYFYRDGYIMTSGAYAYGIRFTDGISTGNYTFDWLVGGTSALSVYNNRNVSFPSGNVGIGTATPAEKLDVVGNAKISGTLTVGGVPVITSSGNGSGLTSLNASQLTTGTVPTTALPSSVVQTTTAQTLTNKTLTSATLSGATVIGGSSSSQQVLVDSTGNVGVGTASPAAKLEVKNGRVRVSSDSAGAGIYGELFQNGEETTLRLQDPGPWGRVTIDTSGSTYSFLSNPFGSNSFAGLVSNSTGRHFAIINSSPTMGIGLHTAGSSTARLFVNSSGNVGIGTTNPGGKLEVANGGIRLQGNSGDPHYYADFTHAYGAGGLTITDVGHAVVNTSLSLYSGNITTPGNIGIGTTAPMAKLDVAGDAQVRGKLRIAPSGDLSMGDFQTGTNPNSAAP
ncbi:MAG: hypothetical protein WC661_00570 [Opitutaceae bacterium]|jgi:hypothetical protein